MSKIKWTYLSVALIAGLFILPRLLSAQFGMMDDTVTISTVMGIRERGWETWDLAYGRFRPVYWLFWLGVYLLGNTDAFIWHVMNALVLLASALLLVYIVSKLSVGKLTGLPVVAFLLLSPPTVETFYTLSKSEGLLVLLVLGAIAWILGMRRRHGAGATIAAITGAALLLLAACAVKETALVMLPFAGLITALRWIKERPDGSSLFERDEIRFLVGAIIGSFLFLVWRADVLGSSLVGMPGYGAKYDIAFASLLRSGVRWAGLMIKDALYGLPLFLLLPLIWKRLDRVMQQLILVSLCWVIVWVGIYLPWPLFQGYYEFPGIVGMAAFSGIVAEAGLQLLRPLKSPSWHRVFLLGAGIGAGLLMSGSVITDGRIQLLTDQVNADVVNFVAEEAPPEALILVNLQVPNEILGGVQDHLAHLLGRDDLRVDIVRPSRFPLEEQNVFLMTPIIENLPSLTVRTGIVESTLRTWNSILEYLLDEDDVRVYENSNSIGMLRFEPLKLVCDWMPVYTYCSGSSSVIDRRTFSYGWQVYNIVND